MDEGKHKISREKIENPLEESYRKASRRFHKEDTVIPIGEQSFGGQWFQVIAGPCSVESQEQILRTAKRVKAAGATMLRGGAFKPRTSPYSFQGLGKEGIRFLLEAGKETGLPVVTEITSVASLEFFKQVDVIQVGARNMQSYELLKALGQFGKPVLLKRGLSCTIEELLMSAEYILAEGNPQVILCERGIRTVENLTRNTLDLSAVAVLKHISHLPVVVDPSHGTGVTWLVEPMSKAAIAAGADGLMIETHDDPKQALSDGEQSLDPDEFISVMNAVRRQAAFEQRTISTTDCNCS